MKYIIRFHPSCDHPSDREVDQIEWNEFIYKKIEMWPKSNPPKYFSYAGSEYIETNQEETIVNISPDRFTLCVNCLKKAVEDDEAKRDTLA